MLGPIITIMFGAAVFAAASVWIVHAHLGERRSAARWRRIAKRKKPGPDRRAAEREAIIARMNWLRTRIGLPEFVPTQAAPAVPGIQGE